MLGSGADDETLAMLQPREVQVIAGESRRGPALEATARRLAGRSLGLVLSGGGARALAHLGALEELDRCGASLRPRGGCEPRLARRLRPSPWA